MTNKKGYFFYPDISYRKKFRMIYKKGYSASIHISDSGGIQTHDLQNFFLPRYQLLEKVLYDKKVTPVGFKPTTFRTGI